MPPLLLVLLAACTLDAEEWAEDRNEALCDLYVACFGTYDDEDACEDELAGIPEPACEDLAPRAARACIRLIEDQADDCPYTQLEDWQIPATCADACEAPGE